MYYRSRNKTRIIFLGPTYSTPTSWRPRIYPTITTWTTANTTEDRLEGGNSPSHMVVFIGFDPCPYYVHTNIYIYIYMAVSCNGGTPNSSISIGSSIMNQTFWVTPFMKTPICMLIYVYLTGITPGLLYIDMHWERDHPPHRWRVIMVIPLPQMRAMVLEDLPSGKHTKNYRMGPSSYKFVYNPI